LTQHPHHGSRTGHSANATESKVFWVSAPEAVALEVV
jgi:hypothetical protein